jgi:regulator of protease activity HflC (stomatin/prohibitin superfamily)
MLFQLSGFIVGVGLGFCCVGALALWRSYFHVDEGHLGVLTRFGKAVRLSTGDIEMSPSPVIDFLEGNDLKLFKAGGHFKWPWDKVTTFSIMERVIDLSGLEGGKYAMAADGTVLRLDSKIRFFPKANDIYSYLFQLKNPMGHIKEMFTCLVRNEIANFRGETKDELDCLGAFAIIRRDRKKLNEQIELICRDEIGVNYGIQFSGVDLLDIVPPQELDAALNGIQNAKTAADTLFARAEGDARQKLVAAEKGIEIAKIRAQSVAQELETLAVMIKKLMNEGNVNNYFFHRKTELLGDAKVLLMQKDI